MKQDKEEKKNSKFKEYYKKFKEAWAIPQKRAGIKLLGYLIFFVILFTVSAIVSRVGNSNKLYNESNTTTTTAIIKEDKYNDKQNNLLNSKHNINYTISINDIEYKINGTLENNIINGYLESTDDINKIIIESDKIYSLKKEEKIELETDIDINLLNLNKIINLIKQNSGIIERIDENNKNYSYKVNYNEKELNIKIYTNENNIYQIDILFDNNSYILNFDN